MDTINITYPLLLFASAVFGALVTQLWIDWRERKAEVKFLEAERLRLTKQYAFVQTPCSHMRTPSEEEIADAMSLIQKGMVET